MKYIIILVLITICSISFLSCSTENSSHQINPKDNMSADTLDSLKITQAEKDNYEPGTWLTDYSLALRLSQESGKPVLINFTGSDWCPWCFRLRDEVFAQDTFIKFAKENLILLMIDFPMHKKLPPEQVKINEALQEKYGIEGYPTVVMVNAEGKEIARTGYREGGADNYVVHLKELLAQ